MADLQSLKKRLEGIRSTGELAQATKTAASAKYTALNRIWSEFSPYAAACEELQRMMRPLPGPQGEPSQRECLLVLGANRGFCGSFHSEVCKALAARLPDFQEPPLLIVCGRRLEKYLRDREIPFEPRELADKPDFTQAKSLLEEVYGLYSSGTVCRVRIICQRFVNMMTRSLLEEQLFPCAGDGEAPAEGDVLCLPDSAAFSEAYALDCMAAGFYGKLLSHACACQAATVIAMRSACDNAEKSSEALSLRINRIRQAEITNSVIETSSGMAAMQSEM